MRQHPETIPVPLDVAQASANAIAKMPAGEFAELMLAWKQLVAQHNQQAQAKREAESKPLDPATERALDALVNGAEARP